MSIVGQGSVGTILSQGVTLSPLPSTTAVPTVSFLTHVALAAAMLGVTAVSGLIPIAILKCLQNRGHDPTKRGWLSYLSCFSGGVFLATFFLDVLPHNIHVFTELKEAYSLDTNLPLPQLVMCCGFFIIYFMEESINVFFADDDDNVETVKIHTSEKGVVFLNNGLHIPEHAETKEEKEEKEDVLRALTFAIAISFHSLLEGFALGVQETSAGLITLFLSLLIHKSVEAFSVGIQLSKAGTSRAKIIVITVIIYALMTPIGSLTGAAIQSSGKASLAKDASMLFLEALAGGTFIYITFIEVIAREKENRFNNFKQLACIIFGFIVITGLTLVFSEA